MSTKRRRLGRFAARLADSEAAPLPVPLGHSFALDDLGPTLLTRSLNSAHFARLIEALPGMLVNPMASRDISMAARSLVSLRFVRQLDL
jgi:hypothetical protein